MEIGKMVQKYGYGQYNGILRILMGQVNCIDSNESNDEKMKYLIESYSKLFVSRGGLSDFIIYDADVQLRNQLNEKRQKPVELVLKKKRGEQFYTERVVGDDTLFEKYKENIKDYIESNVSKESVTVEEVR